MKSSIKTIIAIVSLLILNLFLIFCGINIGEKKVSYAATSNASDVQLMARAINGEARGEPYEGQVAVGAVILNRVKNSRLPKYNIRSNISTRCIYSSCRWANKSSNSRRLKCIQSSPRRYKWMGSNRRMHILF